jgi:hypothetical protein
MSAQPERTPDITGSPAQVTPVIIKSGGDLGDADTDAGTSPVTINLLNKAFESQLKDDRWRSAQSTVPAGMMSLKIQDGDKQQQHSGNPQLAGARLQVIFGTEMLILDNEALHEHHETKLVIQSPVSFDVIKRDPVPDEWIVSRASFPAAKPLVIFSQGGHVFVAYQCETTDVELTLSLDWD